MPDDDSVSYSWPSDLPPPRSTGFPSVPDQRPPPPDAPDITSRFFASDYAPVEMPQTGSTMLQGVGSVAKALYEAGPGTIRDVMTGKLQPGTPEAEAAARNTALTFGLPGGAPEDALSSGVRLGRKIKDAGTRAPLKAPAIGKGTEAPMFDLSNLAERPADVAQTKLPRFKPPEGTPARYIEAMKNPANRRQFRQMVEMGRDRGMGWYGTQPLRHAFHEELGPEMGERAYRRYLDYIGITSPRTPVPQNVRNASYWLGIERRGEEMPHTVHDPGKMPKIVPGPGRPLGLPNPYGGVAQRGTMQAARQLRGMDPLGPGISVRPGGSILDQNAYDLLRHPKPPSFTSNLLGNWQPITADVHNVRGWNLGADLPGPGYGHVESVQQKLARQLGMEPAQLQASGWVGGELESPLSTGNRSGGDPFMTHFEDRVRLTAKARGETPQQSFRKFLRGEADLLHAGDPVSAAASATAQSQQGDQQ